MEFLQMFLRNTFQKILIILVHTITRGNHNSIRNEGFHCYWKRSRKINLPYNVSIRQWLQVLLFALYIWNEGKVVGTEISHSVVAIYMEFPFPVDLSPER